MVEKEMKLGVLPLYNEIDWASFAIDHGMMLCDKILIIEGSQFVAFPDIPDSDPDYATVAWRKDAPKFFKDNISQDNIHFIASNSLFLPLIDLPKEFELIYIDGGHCHPVVGCDTMYSYNRLKKGGGD